MIEVSWPALFEILGRLLPDRWIGAAPRWLRPLLSLAWVILALALAWALALTALGGLALAAGFLRGVAQS